MRYCVVRPSVLHEHVVGAFCVRLVQGVLQGIVVNEFIVA